MMTTDKQIQDLLDFIDVSPSPWHAVKTVVSRLEEHGFVALSEKDAWDLQPGGRYYVVRDGSSIIAFVVGEMLISESGFRIFGAHTDSPGLRVKPRALSVTDQMVRVGVEVYGGPILATFTDRDLSLAGRVSYQTDTGHIADQLVKFDQPLLRLPNLAIHMNRKVNEEGLKLNKQTELSLILSTLEGQLGGRDFQKLLAAATSLNEQQIYSWELNVYDCQKGALWGERQQFIADSQLDNLASCHVGLQALLKEQSLNSGQTLVCAMFDHEEIGSETPKGADGSFLPDILERIALSRKQRREDYQRALANSFMISADMAHAYQPNFPSAYEPEHKVFVNQGPVIKINANQRYTSESVSSAVFKQCCEQVQVKWQEYSHRTDIPCGSTIGPMTAAKLGVRSVDVGNPMWAMHSIRESAGAQDHLDFIEVIGNFFTKPSLLS